MRLITIGGDLPFRSFTFPDGQRHIDLAPGFDERDVQIEARIANADELFDVLLMKDALDARGCSTSLVDPHSSAALRLLGATAVYPLGVARSVLSLYRPADVPRHHLRHGGAVAVPGD